MCLVGLHTGSSLRLSKPLQHLPHPQRWQEQQQAGGFRRADLGPPGFCQQAQQFGGGAFEVVGELVASGAGDKFALEQAEANVIDLEAQIATAQALEPCAMARTAPMRSWAGMARVTLLGKSTAFMMSGSLTSKHRFMWSRVTKMAFSC